MPASSTVCRTAGLLAVCVYCAAVVAGGLATPGYRHLAQPVSDLIATGAPAKALLDPLFALYNLLTAVFGAAIVTMARPLRPSAAARVGTLGGWLLIVEAVAGLLTQAFPEGEGGAHSAIGATGVAHIGFAALSSLSSLAAMLLVGRALSRAGAGRSFWRLSVLCAGFVVLTGVLAGVAVAGSHPLAGLAERLTIGGFLAWLAAAAVATGRRSRLGSSHNPNSG